jgi:hypothetical protein
MNVFSYVLAEGEVDDEPDFSSGFVVDDNIGEAVHVHYRNVRVEFSVDDFLRFAKECEDAREVMDRGNR